MNSAQKQTVNLKAVKEELEALGYGVYPLKSPNASENKVFFEKAWQAHEEAVCERAASGQLYGFEGLVEDRQDSLTEFLKLQEAWVLLLPYALTSRELFSKGHREKLGKVSIMSWEWDYHTVMHQDIQKTIESFGLSTTCYQLHVDSGPWPERRLAALSGAGKIGRNQMILNESFGGAFYVGILGWQSTETIQYIEVPQPLKYLEIEEAVVPSDGIISEQCLTCRLCQQACPGGALINTNEFLPMQCISALSQMKRELTQREKILLGDHIYGCDICQKVCPTNASRYDCQPRQRETAPEIDVFNLLLMSQKAFKRNYGQHGFSWRGLKTLKRNALICLGNTGELLAVEFLHELGNEKKFEGELESVRLWALSRIQERLGHD